MKTHTTLKSKINSAFSLVELLVVIAVIAIIAAIAIPNVSDIISGAGDQAARRTAQTIANQTAAVRATGHTNDYASIDAWTTALAAGIVQSNNYGEVIGEFKVDMPEDTATLAAISNYLVFTQTPSALSIIEFNDAGN